MKTYIKVSDHCVEPGMEEPPFYEPQNWPNGEYKQHLQSLPRLPVERNAYFDGLKEGESFEGVLRFQEYDEGMNWWDDISEREFQEFDAYHRRVIIPHIPEAGGKVEYCQGEDDIAFDFHKANEVEQEGECAHDWVTYQQCCYCGAFKNGAGKIIEASKPDSPKDSAEGSSPEAEGILRKHFDSSDDLQLAITLNPDINRILAAMEEYAQSKGGKG